MFEADLTLRDIGRTIRSTGVVSESFEAFCFRFLKWISGSLSETGGQHEFVALVAEPHLGPSNRIRRYKGYSKIWLARSEPLAPGVTVKDEWHAFPTGQEFLYSVLEGPDTAEEQLVRWGLSRDSRFLICGLPSLTADALRTIVPSAVQIRSRGSEDDVYWDLDVMLRNVPSAGFVAGHTGFTGEATKITIVAQSNLAELLSRNLNRMDRDGQ